MPEEFPPIRAILITSGEYDDPRFRRLNGPKHDSINLAAALETHGNAIVRTLPEQPTKVIRKKLPEFLGTFDDSETVIVYFSGHGVRVDDRLYLATGSTDQDRVVDTAVDTVWLRKELDKCPARAKVLILDCCHAAAGAGEPSLLKGLTGLPALSADAGRPAPGGQFNAGVKGGRAGAGADGGRDGDVFKGGRDGDAGQQGRGLAVLTAASADQPALDGPNGSPYTQVLIAGITSGRADADRDGWVSADELAHHVHDRLAADPRYRATEIETRHYVDAAAGRIKLTKVGRARQTWWPDRAAAAVFVAAALAVAAGIGLTRDNPAGAAIAGVVVGVLACLGYTLTRWLRR